jgi:hypothetical protein
MAALGLRYLVAETDEPVDPRLRRTGTFTTTHGRTLVLYAVDDAVDALVLPRQAALAGLPRLPDCPHAALTCRDVGALWDARDGHPLRVTGRFGTLHVQLPAVDGTGRILLVPELHRPDWTATVDGRPATVVRLFDGLLGVPLPAGPVSRVDLQYRPYVMMGATVAAAVAVVGALAALVIGRPRHRTAEAVPVVTA